QHPDFWREIPIGPATSRSGTRAATEESANLSACRRQPARGGQVGTPSGSAERGARTESSTLTSSDNASGASPRVRSVRRGGRGGAHGGGSEQRGTALNELRRPPLGHSPLHYPLHLPVCRSRY